MIERIESRLPGIVVLGFGLVFTVGAVGYDVFREGRMGPGLMPMMAGLVMMAVGALLAISGVDRISASDLQPEAEVDRARSLHVDLEEPRTETSTQRPASGDGDYVPTPSATRPFAIIGSAIGALVISPWVGLVVALALMMFVQLRVIEHETWRTSIVATTITAVVSWLAFVQWLGVPLPSGSLWGGA